MDLWAESKANQVNEDSKKYFEMENGDFALENGDVTKKRKNKKPAQAPSERPSPNQRTKMTDERGISARRGDQRCVDKRTQAETEEDEFEDEEDFGVKYRGSNKFYADNQEAQQERRGGGNYEAEKYAKSTSSSSDSDDESTITIPEPGRKVEHIAQKLEQTAQKYAREHSPPKFLERRERSAALRGSRGPAGAARPCGAALRRRRRRAVWPVGDARGAGCDRAPPGDGPGPG